MRNEGTGLPKLPRGWVWARLGEIATLGAGNPAPQGDEYFENGVYPFVRVQDMGNLRDKVYIHDTRDHLNSRAVAKMKLLPQGTVLFTKSGMSTLLNQRAILGRDMYVVSHIGTAIPLDRISSAWLYYWLKTLDFKDLTHATTLPSLPLSKVQEILTPLAPLAEQHRIVARLEELFTQLEAGIAALNTAQAQLKRYRQAVLKHAVEGRLTAEWRESHKHKLESATVLLERIKEEKKGARKEEVSTLDTSGLPELPEDWCWADLEQLAAHEPNSITDGPFGSNLKTEHYTEFGPRVIRLQNIGDGKFNDEKAHISQEHFEHLRRHEVFAGDLVIAALGDNPPRSCIIPDLVGPAIVKADCIRFKAHPAIASAEYLNVALNSDLLKRIAKGIVHGVGRPRLNQQQIKSLPIPLPGLAEQRVIVEEVERHLSVVDEMEKAIAQSLQQAARLRQSILHQAFTGRLVPQDPHDEPAEKLLQRIRQEKAVDLRETGKSAARQMELF